MSVDARARHARRALGAILSVLALASCVAQRKINETNWIYELERNSFERKWLAFFGSLDDAQVALLGKVFQEGTDATVADFEKSLDGLRWSKFEHMVEAATACENTRREMIAKVARGKEVPPGASSQESAFDMMKIVPGKPTHLPDDPTDEPKTDCLSADASYAAAFAEARTRQAQNPLPPDRKDIEEISFRLYPFGFARYWRKRAAEWCVTVAAIQGS
jgi:hypothetical protein